MNINKIILVGKVVSDITFSKTETESSMARFTLATNRFFKRDGERKTDTCYHNMVAWDLIAETIARYVKKGDELGVSGRLNNRVKQEDGSYKNYNQVVVEEFYFGDNKNKKEQTEVKEINDEVRDEALGDIP